MATIVSQCLDAMKKLDLEGVLQFLDKDIKVYYLEKEKHRDYTGKETAKEKFGYFFKSFPDLIVNYSIGEVNGTGNKVEVKVTQYFTSKSFNQERKMRYLVDIENGTILELHHDS